MYNEAGAQKLCMATVELTLRKSRPRLAAVGFKTLLAHESPYTPLAVSRWEP